MAESWNSSGPAILEIRRAAAASRSSLVGDVSAREGPYSPQGMALPTAAATCKYARYLVRALDHVIPAGGAYLASALTDGNEQADLAWMRWHCIATRTTPAGTTEDKAQFKLDLLNITSGAVDSTWTAADFTACRTPIETFLNVLAS